MEIVVRSRCQRTAIKNDYSVNLYSCLILGLNKIAQSTKDTSVYLLNYAGIPLDVLNKLLDLDMAM